MSHHADYSILDQPQVLGTVFYPRKGWTNPPPGARDYLIPVNRDVSISARFFPAEQDSPCLLLFHGNGEIACDYDWIAPMYQQAGIGLFVADYRGYGRSGGTPSFTAMVNDAHHILAFFLETLWLQERDGPLFLMGRSLGTTSALEIAFHSPDRFSGLVVESGSSDMLRVLGYHRFPLDWGRAKSLGDTLAAEVAAITLPALIIHGAADMLIPSQEATRLYDDIGSKEKRLVIIQGAGHNDILLTGSTVYFSAIKEFVFRNRGTRHQALGTRRLKNWKFETGVNP